MDYENEARDVVRKWDRQYILEDLPREYDFVLIRDIASAVARERDECVALIGKWMEVLLTTGEPSVTPLDILRIVQSDLLQRGRDNETNMPVLREPVSSSSWA